MFVLLNDLAICSPSTGAVSGSRGKRRARLGGGEKSFPRLTARCDSVLARYSEPGGGDGGRDEGRGAASHERTGDLATPRQLGPAMRGARRARCSLQGRHECFTQSPDRFLQNSQKSLPYWKDSLVHHRTTGKMRILSLSLPLLAFLFSFCIKVHGRSSKNPNT